MNWLGLGGRKGSMLLVAIILVSASLVGLTINARVSAMTPKNSSNAIVQYGRNGMNSLNDLFANFSSMTVSLNSTTPDGSQDSLTASFVVLGVATVAQTNTYIVNVTGSETTNGQNDAESCLVWVSTSTGQIVQTYDNEVGYLTGQKAEQEEGVLSMFTTMPWLSSLNSSTVAVAGSPQPMSIGPLNLNVLTYHSLPGFAEYQNWVVKVGSMGASGLQLIVFSSFYTPSTQEQCVFQILSMTPAA